MKDSLLDKLQSSSPHLGSDAFPFNYTLAFSLEEK